MRSGLAEVGGHARLAGEWSCQDTTAAHDWERPATTHLRVQGRRHGSSIQKTVRGTTRRAHRQVTLPPADGPLLPVQEHAPRDMDYQDVWDGGYADRRGLIRARPLGESTELTEAHTSSSDEGSTQRTRKDKGCGHGVARVWDYFVAAADRFIAQPPLDLDEEEAANTMRPDKAPPVTFSKGMRKLLSVMLIDIIYPDSMFRTIWDGFMVLLLIYVALVTTFMLCFMYDTDPSFSFYEIIDLIINGCFMIDIVFNFRTALRKGDSASSRHVMITDRRFIAARYLAGWFAIDLFAALPWTKILTSFGNYMQLTKLLRLLRLLRLLKLSTAMQKNRMYQGVEERQGAAMARLAIYTVGAILVLHSSACIWFFTAFLESPSLTGTWAEAAGLQDSTNFERYLTSLYFVVITFTTVGYGDVCPVTTVERLMACIGMLIGVVTLGYIISTANSIMGNANKYDRKKEEMQSQVEEFLSGQLLPASLAVEIKNYYDFVSQKQFNDAEDAELINNLPGDLRRDVLRDVHARLIRQVPFFQRASERHEELILDIAASLKLEFYSKGDCVVMEGDWDTELYFITEGRLAVQQYVVRPSAASMNAMGAGPHGQSMNPMTGAAASAYASGALRIDVDTAASAASDSIYGRTHSHRPAGAGGGMVPPPPQHTHVATPGSGAPQPAGTLAGSAAAADAAAAAGGGIEMTAPPASAPPGNHLEVQSPFAGPGAQPVPAEAQAPGQEQAQQPHRRQWRLHYSARVPHRIVRILKPGDYFGEYACLTGCPRTASVVAKRMSELYALKRSGLAAAMSQWPGLLAVWKDCDSYGELERARHRQYFQGGRAPLAMSEVVDVGLENGGDEAAPTSQARYQGFLDHFNGEGGKPLPAEEARSFMAHPPSTTAQVAVA